MSQDSWPSTHLSELLHLKQPANSQAWADFVGRYRPPIVRFSRSLGLQESVAEDITQDILLKLLSKMQSFRYDPSQSFRGWLRTVTRNAVFDSFKAARLPQVGSAASDLLNNAAAPDEQEAMIEAVTEDLRREMLRVAEENARVAFEDTTWNAYLRRRNGQSARQVARDLGMSVAAVHKAKSRVVKKLREELASLLDVAEAGESPC